MKHLFLIAAVMVTLGKKQWCTVNTEWGITECLYDTKADCEYCKYDKGTGGLSTPEYCKENPNKNIEGFNE